MYQCILSHTNSVKNIYDALDEEKNKQYIIMIFSSAGNHHQSVRPCFHTIKRTQHSTLNPAQCLPGGQAESIMKLE